MENLNRDLAALRIELATVKASERRYRELVEGLPEPLVVHIDHKIAYANRACAEGLGVASPAELIGCSVADFATPSTRAAIEERMSSQLEDGRSLEIIEQSFVRRDDGRVFHAEIKSTAFEFEGRPAVLSIARDIGRRLEAERATKLAHGRLEAVLSALPVGVWIADATGRVIQSNPAAARIWGGPPDLDDASHHERYKVFSPTTGKQLVAKERALARTLWTGVTIVAEATDIERFDGTRGHVLTSSAPIVDEGGRTVGGVVVMLDVAAERAAERDRQKLANQLRQAQKMEAVGRLAAGVAHDFNNILSVVLSYTTLHLDALKAEDPLRDDLAEIHKAGLRAVGLTRQLLAFSRQQVLRPQVLDLDETLEGLDKMLRRVVGEDIDLTLLTCGDLGGVYADAGQIEQVIMNLVVNARDAMPTGGKLTIETSNVELDAGFASSHLEATPGPYVLVAITDTGTGMDPVTRAQIFEPFFTTKGAKGTGLGLATAFGIVHQTGGTIWVYSELGHGTTFKIYLPRTHAAIERLSSPSIAVPAVGGTDTILLVEDDEGVRILVRTVLRRAGYTVLDAENGGEAFLIAEQFPAAIQLLLTDLVMPRMSGRQIATRLEVERPTMKVLYMSGYADDTVLQHGVLEPGMAFIQKPITPDTLLRQVRRVLDGRSVQTARLRDAR